MIRLTRLPRLALFLSIICLTTIGCLYKAHAAVLNKNPNTKSVNFPYISPRIDYNNFETCLKPGLNTKLSPENLKRITSRLIMPSQKDMTGVRSIFQWVSKNFKMKHAKGEFIGKRNINDILRDKKLTGCFDAGILLSGILKSYGYPAVMVDAVGIDWLSNYQKRMIVNHVFVECYVENRWILIDSVTGDYIEDYDRKNPVIPIKKFLMESKGFYVILKGIDPNDFGINSVADLSDICVSFAKNCKLNNIQYPKYHIKPLTKFFSFRFDISFRKSKK